MVDVPLPSTAALIAFALGAIAGSLAPTYYASERLRGFGRALLSRLPYQPPPGQEREEALQEAVDGDE